MFSRFRRSLAARIPAEGFRAFEGRDDAVAAVSNKTEEIAGRESHVDMSLLIEQPILWMVIRNGGMLSCSILRSHAVRGAGLFNHGMHVSEDTDFLIKLFLLGGAARSASRPVRQIKAAPLEPTEPRNLSEAFPDMPYLRACHRESAVPMLPAALIEQRGPPDPHLPGAQMGQGGFPLPQATAAASRALPGLCIEVGSRLAAACPADLGLRPRPKADSQLL
jgi:hypothetical protein